VDTGETMLEVVSKVNEMAPSDVKVVTLLKRKENSPPVDHFCFEIDKEWVVGYGLDDNSLKRNYRNIYKIN
jgi:hypoxanthine phosphoribosyltransferase